VNDREREMAEAIKRAERDEELEEERPYERPQTPKSPSQVYSLRIPVDRIEELRRAAEQRGVQPSALMRQWVMQKLDEARAKPVCVTAYFDSSSLANMLGQESSVYAAFGARLVKGAEPLASREQVA